MRCRDVEALWDEVREDCGESLKEAVDIHLRACPHCQELYEEFQGVAFCLSCLPQPEASCDLTKRVVEHIAQIKQRERTTPVVLASAQTPIGRLYVGFKEARIAYVGIDTGEDFELVRARVETRLRRPVIAGEAPPWLSLTLEQFFNTWHIDDQVVDIEDPVRTGGAPRCGSNPARRGALLFVGSHANRSPARGSRRRTGHGPQSACRALSLPPRRRRAGRTP
jgi:hypothetical protein